jgi:tetratricopeptide (TPR) repeat protein
MNNGMKKLSLLVFTIWIAISLSAQSSDNFYVKGRAELLKGNYENAVVSLSDAIDHNNSDERYYLNRAEAYRKLGRNSQALDDFEEANNLLPGCGDLGIAKISAATGDNGKAFQYLTSHLRSAFRLPESVLTKDPALDPIKPSDEWLALWQQDWYDDFDKTRVEVDYLVRKQTPEAALDYLNPLMLTFKDKADYFALRAGLYMMQDNYAAALVDYSMALSLDKNKPEYYFGRGEAFLRSEKFKNAVDDFSKGLRMEPAQFEYYLERAKASSGLEDYKSAIGDAGFYIGLFPEDQKAISLCGELCYLNEDYINALKYFNQNIKADPDNADYYKARGKTYLKTKTYTYAINDLSMSLDLKPDDGDTWLYLGLAKFETGDKEAACSCLRKAQHYGNTLALKYIIEYCGN